METDTTQNSANTKEAFILFEVAGTTYGVRSSNVQQIEMIEKITPVPNTPAYIDGVMFSRGDVIPVVNLRSRFGLKKIDYDIKTRVIVVRNGERSAGIIADSAKEYVNLPAESVQGVPEFFNESDSKWLEGIAKTSERTILICNIRELLKADFKELNFLTK